MKQSSISLLRKKVVGSSIFQVSEQLKIRKYSEIQKYNKMLFKNYK